VTSRETETRRRPALPEDGPMGVKLYAGIAGNGHIATTDGYPVTVNGRSLMATVPAVV
jgi:alpha-D-ribose 1-methylphosphonate 5-phosphate C-P lyase